jgi:hypothetical protein
MLETPESGLNDPQRRAGHRLPADEPALLRDLIPPEPPTLPTCFFDEGLVLLEEYPWTGNG